MEGEPIQELSAIQMNVMTRQIVDVYHRHAKTNSPDTWARLHIHGLSNNYLNQNGLENEEMLILDFKKWLRGKDIIVMYANDPRKERTALNLPIKDLNLPKWIDRVSQPYHEIAINFKQNCIPILDKRCSKHIHAVYTSYPLKKRSKTELAKFHYGFHCSLYDAYEMYLYYVSD